MKRLLSLLNANAEVTDYRIQSIRSETDELFFVRRRAETVRKTTTSDVRVTVYVAADGALGDSDFSVHASATDDEIAEKIAAAVRRAKRIRNRPYALPARETLEETLPSNLADRPGRETATRIAEAVFAADTEPNGSINALEIFLCKETRRVVNSRGIDKAETKYRAMVEAIPTWNEGESVELYRCLHFTEFDAAAVTAEIADAMRAVRARHFAAPPTAPIACKIVLRPRELSELFAEIAWDLNFASVYGKSNLFGIGESIAEGGTGDPITLTATGQIKGSRFSSLFDEDGVTLREQTIVERGVAKANFGTNRFAQYLGETPTGNLRCLRLAGGTLTREALAKEPYLECVSLSGLQVDRYNDYLGGEVRLAYYFDGERTVPITGISISGSLRAALRSIRLSAECTIDDDYEGPAFAALSGLTIL